MVKVTQVDLYLIIYSKKRLRRGRTASYQLPLLLLPTAQHSLLQPVSKSKSASKTPLIHSPRHAGNKHEKIVTLPICWFCQLWRKPCENIFRQVDSENLQTKTHHFHGGRGGNPVLISHWLQIWNRDNFVSIIAHICYFQGMGKHHVR